MPWMERDVMSLRAEFCAVAQQGAVSVTVAAARFGISRKTAYKWLARAARGEALEDRSRRPHHSPTRTPPAVETAVLALRDTHPTWGSRKLQAVLRQEQQLEVPPSTIDRILTRHGRIDPAMTPTHRPGIRFEAAAPMQLLQLDFTGHFPLDHGRCHPLPLLDDHSRFLLSLTAEPNERGTTVQPALAAAFARYGLPDRLLCDYGPPWGTSQAGPGVTTLGVWLMSLDIEVLHGRPHHPQTRGKLERFNRTLNAEVIQGAPFHDLATVQAAFDAFRDEYNQHRPHGALAQATPLSRFAPSPRSYPPPSTEFAYAPDDVLRKVDQTGRISWLGRTWAISDALAGQVVALRPVLPDGEMEVYFHRSRITRLGWPRDPTAE